MSDNIFEMKTKNPVEFKKYVKLGITILALILLLVILLGSLFIVKQGEYKVVRQFGEVVRIEKDPGLYMKAPFIQSVTVMPNKKMVYDMDQQEINTLDKKRIIIDNYAVWYITDPTQLINNAKTVANAEARMGEFIFSIIRAELGSMEYEQIINDEATSRTSLNERVTDTVNELLELNNYGAQVSDVRIKRTDLPDDNEKSVYQRMISERDSKAQEYLSKGDAEKNRIIAQTDRQVTEMISTAEAEAAEIRSEGEQEAAQIYNESFEKDADFYRLYRTLQSYEKTIDGKTTIVIPHDSPYAKILLGYFE
ncbi:protease modulator HflC [Salirhabdus salicampi]|uniref:protease modulator HflC n=1 Tax=Salirhabdus salicampi TaxID=476102 RepID=UPI0020C2215A|nr:protease modulator HflC [Salirhabdus salicampi]MCP8617088.1 protease modulator HflC [Salirhabdus salicampi]